MSTPDISTSTPPTNPSSQNDLKPSRIIKLLLFLLFFTGLVVFATVRLMGGLSQAQNTRLLTEACRVLHTSKVYPALCKNPATAVSTSLAETGLMLGIFSVGVTSNGDVVITINTSDYTTVPTLLGSYGPYHAESITFTEEAKQGKASFVDPLKEFPGQRTLTIYSGPQQYVYDLSGFAFEATFEDVDVKVWTDPSTESVFINILEPTQADKPPVFEVVQVAMVGGAYTSMPSDILLQQDPPASHCTVVIGDVVAITENARTWESFSVEGARPTSTLDISHHYYLAEGPQWGSIRWDSDAKGWWWKVHNNTTNESLGWIWEGRIEPCH